jgi:hypothetical protein
MALFRQKRPRMTREQLLRARPIRSPLAEVRQAEEGRLEITVPFQKPRGLRWFFRGQKVLKRRFDLDRLGQKVWELCDGQHTVRQLIETFTETEGLNAREAEVSMITYLEVLGSRGIVLMAAGDGTASRT